MAIAGMREGDVIDERIAEDQPEKQPRAGTAFAQSASQPPQGQYRRGQKHKILNRWSRGNLRWPGTSGPIINKSLYAESRKPKVILEDERDCLALPLGYVGNLPEFTVPPHLVYVLCGVQIFPPRAVRARPISDAQLGAKIRTQKDNLAGSPVVPNQPRSDASKEYDRSHRYSAD